MSASRWVSWRVTVLGANNACAQHRHRDRLEDRQVGSDPGRFVQVSIFLVHRILHRNLPNTRRVFHSTIPAPRLNDVGLRSYDPAYLNTAVARSKICEVDGDNGILRYGGYPIEQIAEHGTHTEVAFLLHHGELPTAQQQSEWNKAIMEGTEIPGQLVEMLKYFDRNAHPMGALVSLMSALGTFNPDDNPALRGQDMFRGPSPKRMATMARMIGSISTIAAAIFRHHSGLPFIAPDPSLGYAENFLYMCFGKRAQPELVRAMDVLFIAHADHEMNCSTAAIRHVGSSLADPYLAVSGAIAA